MDWQLTVIFVVILALVSLVPSLYRMTIDFAEPGVWFGLFYFFHFGTRGLYDILFKSILLKEPPSVLAGAIHEPLVVAILGLVAFWAGYFGLTRGYETQLDIHPNLPSRWNYTQAVYVGVCCLAVGWAIRVGMMYLQAGGIVAWITAPKNELLYIPGLAYIKLLQRTIPTAGLFILSIVGKKVGDTKYFVFLLPFLVSEIGFRIIIGKRSRLFFFLLMLVALTYMISDRRAKISSKLTLGSSLLLGVLVALFPIISRLRKTGTDQLGAIVRDIPNLLTDFRSLFQVVGRRLHGLDSLALVMNRVPQDVSYTYFSELLLVPVATVPRAVWPGKPLINMGLRFNHMIVPWQADPQRAIAVTMPGMFYWDAGIVGVLIGMAFVGVLWRFLYEYFVRPKGNLTGAFVTAMIFPTFFMPVEQTLVSLFTWHFFKFCIVATIALLVVGNPMDTTSSPETSH